MSKVPPTPAGARTRAARSQVRSASRSSTMSSLSANTVSTAPSPQAAGKHGASLSARAKPVVRPAGGAARPTASSLSKATAASKPPDARSRTGSEHSASAFTPLAHRKMAMTAVPPSVSQIRANNDPLRRLENVPNRSAVVEKASPVKSPAKKVLAAPPAAFDGGAWGDAEPIKAFLRIRPAPDDKERAEPYIQVVNETTVLMSPPDHIEASLSNSRSNQRARRNAQPPTKYSFSRVFAPDTVNSAPSQSSNAKSSHYDGSQASFFRHTTLPMVQEVLQGQSGLVFTYGVTNSGKSYTVQGGEGKHDAGILPRSMDTIFNSIQGLESKSDIRPVGLMGVERSLTDNSNSDDRGVNPFSLPALSSHVASTAGSAGTPYEPDETSVKVDRNLRYSVWVSYVEVYNEKLFDLLDVAPASSTSANPNSGMTRSMTSNWSISGMGANSTPSNEPITLNRRPLQLKRDLEAGGKYVAGLRDVRVHSAAEAHELLRRGQENRAVFGTMANRASSRSHGVFTVKILREHAGADGDESASLSCSTSRLSIVDLAGSERVANTGVTNGDRLKEAGNINKSLMCLGQCLETLRKNQARAWSAIPAPLLLDPSSAASETPFTSSVASPSPRPLFKRRPSIVPFRHSKLTELFESFFTGDGRAVMIVNANPYDTGFDENNHVMRFSAAAKEVHTLQRPAGTGRNVVSLKGLFEDKSAKEEQRRGLANARDEEVKRRLTLPHDVTIVEESDNDEDDADPRDPFVEYLVQKHEELAQQLFDAQMRCAMIETEVREEMASEMDERLQEMESAYNERVMVDAEQQEELANRKLDLLTRFNASEQQQRQQSWIGRTPGTVVRNRLEEEEVEGALASIEEREDPDSPTVYAAGRLANLQEEEDTDVGSDESVLLTKGPSSAPGGKLRTLDLTSDTESAEADELTAEEVDIGDIADEEEEDESAFQGESEEEDETAAEETSSSTFGSNDISEPSISTSMIAPPVRRSGRTARSTGTKLAAPPSAPATTRMSGKSVRGPATAPAPQRKPFAPLDEITHRRNSRAPSEGTHETSDDSILLSKGKRKVKKLKNAAETTRIGAQVADSSLVRAMKD